MSFKTRPSAYQIRLATGRARCRKCKGAVPKGSARVVTTAFVMPGRVTCFSRCVGCIDGRFAAAVLAVYGRADRVPVDGAVPASAAMAAVGSIRARAEGT